MRTRRCWPAEMFQVNGHRTGIFGTWHNGEHLPNNPAGQGFDEFLGAAPDTGPTISAPNCNGTEAYVIETKYGAFRDSALI